MLSQSKGSMNPATVISIMWTACDKGTFTMAPITPISESIKHMIILNDYDSERIFTFESSLY